MKAIDLLKLRLQAELEKLPERESPFPPQTKLFLLLETA